MRSPFMTVCLSIEIIIKLLSHSQVTGAIYYMGCWGCIIIIFFFLRDFILKKTLFEKLQY